MWSKVRDKAIIIIPLTFITFDNVEAAERALAALNGQDIYAGCCTLKIDYSKVSNVPKIKVFFSVFLNFFSLRNI